MTRDELLREVRETREMFPDLRYGQALFNVAYWRLGEVRTEAAAKVADPFYDDSKADAFLDELGLE